MRLGDRIRPGHLLSSNRGTIASLGVIAGLVIGGGLLLRSEFRQIQAEVPQIEASKLREGFIALGDLHRIEATVDEASGAVRVTPRQRDAVQAALDYLYLRADSFKRLNQATADNLSLGRTFDRIVEAGDRALAGGPVELKAFERDLGELIGEARTELVHYVDSQHQAQSNAIAEQSRLLERMTVTAGVLLLVFGHLAATAVLLLKAEIRANRKRMAAEEQARFLAYFDPLTGLFNRTSFQERAAEVLRSNAEPIVILFDLDEFKAINDGHGHAAGDVVLRTVAERIDRVAREHHGIAARLGGDEFVALLPGPLSDDEVTVLCHRLLRVIRAPVRSEGTVFTPLASLGVCQSRDLQSRDPAEGGPLSTGALLRAADLALYEAKTTGRNTFVRYDQTLADKINERREIERALPEALRNGEFFVVFQPQIDLSTEAIYGVEALVRWQRGDRVLSPAAFIPVAEDIGLIKELDLWVLRSATRAVARWIEDGSPEISLSVNLSSRHFHDTEIVEHMQDVLTESGLPPHLLILEITETVLLEDGNNTTDVIEKLHALGVGIAVDDFGTGYSSFRYLHDLAVDVIKIDRSFITRLECSREAQFILDALVDMAKRLKMRVVVEGVETDQQVQLAKSFGCDTAQGFFFDHPLEASEIRARLRALGDERKAAAQTQPQAGHT